jgi:hypothetical protein
MKPEAFKQPDFVKDGVMEMNTSDILKEIMDRLFPPVPEEFQFIVDSKQPIITLEASKLKEARWSPNRNRSRLHYQAMPFDCSRRFARLGKPLRAAQRSSRSACFRNAAL